MGWGHHGLGNVTGLGHHHRLGHHGLGTGDERMGVSHVDSLLVVALHHAEEVEAESTVNGSNSALAGKERVPNHAAVVSGFGLCRF